jgi:ubiquinone/menaquinone biosynthesis C-methylase UbiE
MSPLKFIQLFVRAFGPGVFPHQYSWVLDLPGRGLIMSAKTVASRLPVPSDAHILEVGPGSGYYSVEASRRVPNGHLTLVDIQPEMLALAARRLSAAGVQNFDTKVSDGEGLPFDDCTFDAVFMVTVLGEVEHRDAFLREVFRILKPGGVLSITEHHPDPDFEPEAVVRQRLKEHGFTPDDASKGWRWAYTLNAIRPFESEGVVPDVAGVPIA